jgi:hypothetical protein
MGLKHHESGPTRENRQNVESAARTDNFEQKLFFLVSPGLAHVPDRRA